MDENADLRLTIETARKNKDWTRRCCAYELATEYFSLLEPDCYELCSYCDSIPEFLEEKNECCLTRALGAVKVFVNRCVDASTIARVVTRVIIDKIFFRASTKVREMATDIILDFIEWEACNVILKELIAGALKYDGVRSDECIKVMRYALLDFGPHVISVYKLIDFIAVLVRNKSFLSIDDECSQLLIVIYKCLGPQVRVHLTQILDPDYIAAIEDNYEEMRNIPIYHCRFVRYSIDNSSLLRESVEEVFAACRIAEPTSHPLPVPTNYVNDDMVAGEEVMALDAYQSCFTDFGTEPYYREGDAGPFENENKCYWNPQRFENMANYPMGNGVGGSNQEQRNQVDVAIAFEVLDQSNRTHAVPELFRHVSDAQLFPEPEQQDFEWNPDNFEICLLPSVDKSSQTDGYSLEYSNPYELIIQKLMDNYGTYDILYWLSYKLKFSPKTQQKHERIKESRELNLSRNCKSLEALQKNNIHTHNKKRCTSRTDRLCFSDRVITSSHLNGSNENSFHSKSVVNMNKDENSIRKISFPSSLTNNRMLLQDSEKENDKMKMDTLRPLESVILSQDYLHTKILQETKEKVSELVNTKSQLRTTASSLVSKFFQKVLFPFSKKKNMPNNILEGRRPFCKKIQSVFKGKRNHRSLTDQNPFYLMDILETNYSDDKTVIYFSDNTEYSCSYFEKHIDTCPNSYSINRFANVPSKRSVFSSGWQTDVNQNETPTRFLSSQEQLQHKICQNEGIQSTSNMAEENVNEEMICLSESDSVTEIFPNLCCYCFQKNSIRRLTAQKSEDDDGKTVEKDQDEAEGRIALGFPGPDAEGLVLDRTDGNSSLDSRTDGNLFGGRCRSSRLRGAGDELSQPTLCGQTAQQESVPAQGSQLGQRAHKLFCCISMEDANEEAI